MDLKLKAEHVPHHLSALVQFARWLRRCGRRDLALAALSEAIEASKGLGLWPCDELATIARSLDELEDLPGLAWMIPVLEQRLARKEPSPGACESLISGLVRNGALDLALSLLEKQRSKWTRADGIRAVLEALAECPAPLRERLLQLADEIAALLDAPHQLYGQQAFVLAAERWRCWTVCRIALALAGWSNTAEARGVLQAELARLDAPGAGPASWQRAHKICHIAPLLDALEQRELAAELLREAQAHAIEQQDDVDGPSDLLLQQIVDAWVTLRNLPQARSACRHITQSHRQLEARCAILRALVRRENVEEALEMARERYEVKARRHELGQVIRELAGLRRFEAALDALGELAQEPYALAEALEPIALNLEQATDSPDAPALLERLRGLVMGIEATEPGSPSRPGMPTSHIRTPVLRAVARGFARLRNHESALSTARQAKPDWHRALALLDVAEQQCCVGSREQALANVREAHELATAAHRRDRQRFSPDPAEHPALLAELALRWLTGSESWNA